jgi:DNA-binding XRE family transcriptional regulator
MTIKANQEAARQFKALRTEAKITQDAAADACDCSPRSIRSWERGDTQVPAAAFVDLLDHILLCEEEEAHYSEEEEAPECIDSLERMTDPRYR